MSNYLYLDLVWTQLKQETKNNRTRVKMKLKLRHTGGGIYFSAPKKGKLDGTSFTYTGGFSGTGTRTLYTKTRWISHNSNGSKSYTFKGSFNPQISYGSGGGYTTHTVSGKRTFKKIPRQSSLTSASLNAHLKPNTANKVNVRISSQTSYGHWIDVKYGNTLITSLHSTGKPASVALSSAEVNKLLNAAKSTTKPTLTINMSTRSGSTKIGSTVSRNATATVHSTVKPTVSGFGVSIQGSGRDNTIGKYVQGITRVSGKYTRSAGYGASISSSQIIVRQVGGANSQTINSNNGTTSGVVSQSGNYEALAVTRDSRGRTNTTEKVTFKVEAYRQPSISKFDVVRQEDNDSKVTTTRAGSWNTVGGSNNLTILIQHKERGASAWTETKRTSATSGNFNNVLNVLNIKDTSAYRFKLTITDTFGNKSISERQIGTAKTVLDIHKNLGVGIGKMHEQGELDVAGDLYVNGVNISEFKTELPKGDGTVAYWQSIRVGRYMCEPNTFPSQPESYGFVDIMGRDESVRERTVVFYGRGNNRDIVAFIVVNDNASQEDSKNWKYLTGESGSNSNGRYIKFADGTMICYKTLRRSSVKIDIPYGNLYREDKTNYWVYPHPFSDALTISNQITINGFGNVGAYITAQEKESNEYRILGISSSTRSCRVYHLAIGRWK